jgi:hypothetical protein
MQEALMLPLFSPFATFSLLGKCTVLPSATHLLAPALMPETADKHHFDQVLQVALTTWDETARLSALASLEEIFAKHAPEEELWIFKPLKPWLLEWLPEVWQTHSEAVNAVPLLTKKLQLPILWVTTQLFGMHPRILNTRGEWISKEKDPAQFARLTQQLVEFRNETINALVTASFEAFSSALVAGTAVDETLKGVALLFDTVNREAHAAFNRRFYEALIATAIRIQEPVAPQPAAREKSAAPVKKIRVRLPDRVPPLLLRLVKAFQGGETLSYQELAKRLGDPLKAPYDTSLEWTVDCGWLLKSGERAQASFEIAPGFREMFRFPDARGIAEQMRALFQQHPERYYSIADLLELLGERSTARNRVLNAVHSLLAEPHLGIYQAPPHGRVEPLYGSFSRTSVAPEPASNVQTHRLLTPDDLASLLREYPYQLLSQRFVLEHLGFRLQDRALLTTALHILRDDSAMPLKTSRTGAWMGYFPPFRIPPPSLVHEPPGFPLSATGQEIIQALWVSPVPLRIGKLVDMLYFDHFEKGALAVEIRLERSAGRVTAEGSERVLFYRLSDAMRVLLEKAVSPHLTGRFEVNQAA